MNSQFFRYRLWRSSESRPQVYFRLGSGISELEKLAGCLLQHAKNREDLKNDMVAIIVFIIKVIPGYIFRNSLSVE